MNKLNKIFLILIIILLILLSCLTYEYINLRKQSKENLNSLLENAKQLQEVMVRVQELEEKVK